MGSRTKRVNRQGGFFLLCCLLFLFFSLAAMADQKAIESKRTMRVIRHTSTPINTGSMDTKKSTKESETRSSPEPEGPADYDTRTQGKACIYRGDEVIYRPPGARCKGDSEALARPAAQKKEPSHRTARCMYGVKGEVLYAPPGADCIRNP